MGHQGRSGVQGCLSVFDVLYCKSGRFVGLICILFTGRGFKNCSIGMADFAVVVVCFYLFICLLVSVFMCLVCACVH